MKYSKNISKLSDNDLIQRIVESNDTQLFAILYDRYSHLVFNKCYGFATSKEEAQDLTHDIFIKLFIKLRTFKGTAKFSTWLYSFTYNFCVNYVTRNKHNKHEKYIKERQIEGDEIEEFDSSEESLFALKVDKLKESLELIDPNDKMILLLKYQDDFSIKDIEKALQINSSAVKMRLKRARERVINVYRNLN